jgi:Cdc6-like AAA superfamily ATPase
MEVQLSLQHAEQLLDFSQKLDINLLDTVVNCLYNSIGQQQQIAQKILNDFKEHPDAWTRVDVILEYSNNVHTKVLRSFCIVMYPIHVLHHDVVVLQDHSLIWSASYLLAMP